MFPVVCFGTYSIRTYWLNVNINVNGCWPITSRDQQGHYSFHQNQYKSHYNQWHHYKGRDGVYCLCLFSSGSWGYLSKRAWFLYLNQCELVWTSQIHSVYIWMTHSHMRLCCSTIHNSNVQVIMCSGPEACASGGVFSASNAGGAADL